MTDIHNDPVATGPAPATDSAPVETKPTDAAVKKGERMQLLKKLKGIIKKVLPGKKGKHTGTTSEEPAGDATDSAPDAAPLEA